MDQEETSCFPVTSSASLIPEKGSGGRFMRVLCAAQRSPTVCSLPLCPEAHPSRSDEDTLSPAPAMVGTNLTQRKTRFLPGAREENRADSTHPNGSGWEEAGRMNPASQDSPDNPLPFLETSWNPNQRQETEREAGGVGGEDGIQNNHSKNDRTNIYRGFTLSV